MRRVTRAICLGLLAWSCGPHASGGSVPRDSRAQVVAGAQRAAVEPESRPADAEDVELLDPGRVPRTSLRHSFRTGAVQRFHVRATTILRGEGLPGGEARDELRANVVSRIEAVRADGSARFEAELTTTAAGVPPESSPSSPPSSLTRQGSMTPRGTVRILDGSSDEASAQLWRLAEPCEPFPVEPIGVGAKWIVRQRLTEADSLIEQATTYELVDRRDDLLTTRVRRVQTPATSDPPLESRGELTTILGHVFPEGTWEMSDELEPPGGGLVAVNARVEIRGAD